MSIMRMQPDAPLVDAIRGSPWWQRVKELCLSDHAVNVQVREDYLNIYYRMGNVMKVSGRPGAIKLEMHKKYVPISYAHTGDYLPLVANGASVDIDAEEPVKPILSDLLSVENWNLLTERIGLYVKPEQDIHTKLMTHNSDTIIDTEVQASGIGRVDFLNLDKHTSRIVAIELKRIDDERLYKRDMEDQIDKYVDLLNKNPTGLIEACRNTLATKNRLGLLSSGSFLHQAIDGDMSVELRPLLVIACGSQEAINMLREKIEETLDKMRSKLSGVFFFGDVVDFNLRAAGNKKLY